MDPDVIVAGGGILGLSIAYSLKQRHLRPLVLERAARPAREASWAGAGMLAPHGELLPDAWWTDLAFASLAAYPAWVERLTAESGHTIDFRICGAREWRNGEIREFSEEGIVDPRDVTAALHRLVPVVTGSPVSNWTVTPGGVEVAGYRVRALVVAAGAWSGQLPSLPPSLPIRGHMLAYRMPRGSLGPILRRGHTYILQRNSGLTLVGSTEEKVGFNRRIERAALVNLAARGAALWPELAGRPWDDAWVGFRPATPSGFPEMRQLPGQPVWLAYGHYRNGILLAPKVGEWVSASVAAILAGGTHPAAPSLTSA